MTKRAAARQAREAQQSFQQRQKLMGVERTFAGTSAAGLLPFGHVWETSDGYKVQCVSVAHNMYEAGHYIGTMRVVGVSQNA